MSAFLEKLNFFTLFLRDCWTVAQKKRRGNKKTTLFVVVVIGSPPPPFANISLAKPLPTTAREKRRRKNKDRRPLWLFMDRVVELLGPNTSAKKCCLLYLFLLYGCTVRKMDLILRSIGRRPQMQLSMARRFKLQLLRRYSVKFYKKRKFTLGMP